MRGIAFRRHKREIAKAKAKNIAKDWRVDPNPKRIGMMATTPAPCSCDMCGNPRRHWKQKTIQEIKADEAFSMERGQDGNAADC